MRRHQFGKEYVRRLSERYRASSKKAKTVILDEFCKTTGYSRKAAIRLMRRGGDVVRGRPGPRVKYDDRLNVHIKTIWVAMERINGKRMKAALPYWLPYYRALGFTPELKRLLMEMSAATLERSLKRIRKLSGLSVTKTAKFFRHKIPLCLTEARAPRPGHVAADTVAHCGDRIEGSYVHSLTVTDRCTDWTENRAMPCKKARMVRKALYDIERNTPFTWLSFQSDCGTEFLNYVVMSYLQGRARPVGMTRSRPYHKNDNALVEQKNNTHVRNLLGYDRIERPDLVELLNEIYREYWNPLNNFFLPSVKLKTKERIGARIKKTYELPTTPYLRLMEAENVTAEQKARLKERYDSLDPFALKQGLEQKLRLFFQLLKADESLDIAA